MKASEMYQVLFPKCSRECETVEILGVSECESVCPHKFNTETGKPLEILVRNKSHVSRDT